jgi:hypothetical protein
VPLLQCHYCSAIFDLQTITGLKQRVAERGHLPMLLHCGVRETGLPMLMIVLSS